MPTCRKGCWPCLPPRTSRAGSRRPAALTDEQIRLFWDEQSKGFYFTSKDHEALIARTRNAFDAVLPSANAVSVRNLVRLASLCGEPHYRDLARQTLEAFAPALTRRRAPFR